MHVASSHCRGLEELQEPLASKTARAGLAGLYPALAVILRESLLALTLPGSHSLYPKSLG